jgi:hypothetical protein
MIILRWESIASREGCDLLLVTEGRQPYSSRYPYSGTLPAFS